MLAAIRKFFAQREDGADKDNRPDSPGDFPPSHLVIPRDDHHGRYVGRSASGDGVFITTPFTFGRNPADSRVSSLPAIASRPRES